MWVEPVATTKLLGYLHSPHQREFYTEGLLGRQALGMLGRTLKLSATPHIITINSLIRDDEVTCGNTSSTDCQQKIQTCMQNDTMYILRAAHVTCITFVSPEGGSFRQLTSTGAFRY